MAHQVRHHRATHFQLPWGAVGFDHMDEVMATRSPVRLARQHPARRPRAAAVRGADQEASRQVRDRPHRKISGAGGAGGSKHSRSLLRLVDTGRCWVKLSAPYETSKTGAPSYEDVSRLARALVKHAPERMLWASNWPHPSAPRDNIPDDADLIDLLLDWAPDDATARRSWSTTRPSCTTFARVLDHLAAQRGHLRCDAVAARRPRSRTPSSPQ